MRKSIRAGGSLAPPPHKSPVLSVSPARGHSRNLLHRAVAVLCWFPDSESRNPARCAVRVLWILLALASLAFVVSAWS